MAGTVTSSAPVTKERRKGDYCMIVMPRSPTSRRAARAVFSSSFVARVFLVVAIVLSKLSMLLPLVLVSSFFVVVSCRGYDRGLQFSHSKADATHARKRVRFPPVTLSAGCLSSCGGKERANASERERALAQAPSDMVRAAVAPESTFAINNSDPGPC